MQATLTRTVWKSAWDRHAGDLLRFAARRIPRAGEAEDLVQEAFARVIERSPDLETDANLRGYLFATVRNLLANRFRRARMPLFSEMGSGEGFSWVDRVEDRSAPSPEGSRLETELGERFREALLALPERQRRAFESAVLEGKPYRQVAEEEGWSLEQVKINVFRARKSLMARLEPAVGRSGS